MTDRTPIQFGDDDHQLLRQIAGLVQESHYRLSNLEQIVSDLGKIVSERLQDTRPMWEQLNAGLDRIDIRLAETATKEEVRDVNRSLSTLTRDLHRWIHDFDERLEKLKKH